MVQIEHETDIERLRQVALLQHAELTRRHQRLAALTTALAIARGDDTTTSLQLERQILQEQLAAKTRALFAPTSERRPRDGTGADDAPRPAPRGHGPRPQPTLPLVEIVHTLDAADLPCPQCGGDLLVWDGQTEDAEEIDGVEPSFRLVRHRRQKYRCRCGGCVDTALGPPH